MTKEISKDQEVSRRKFLKTGSAVAGVAVASAALAACGKKEEAKSEKMAAPAVVTKPTDVLKVQAAWGGGIFLEFAQDYVNRVNEMAEIGRAHV